MATHRLLVISNHAAEFSELLTTAQLPELSFTCVLTPEAACPHCEDAEILFGAPELIAPLLEHCPELKWVQSSWAGTTPLIDHPRRGYALSGVKGIFGQVMAEYTLAWLLNFERRVSRHTEASHWDDAADGSLLGKSIGIMGTGSIGEAVAGFLKPFGMSVHGLNSDGHPVSHFDRCFPFSDRLAFAEGLDYLLVLLPDTPTTNRAVDAALLAQLQPGAILINAGRGNSVDNAALLRALANGQLGHAVLDVLEAEPLPDDDPLWQVKNLHITSHTAAPSLSASIVGIFCDNYRRFHAGEALHHLIDFAKGY